MSYLIITHFKDIIIICYIYKALFWVLKAGGGGVSSTTNNLTIYLIIMTWNVLIFNFYLIILN